MQTKVIYTIYKATSPNGKQYIGFTNNFKSRKRKHIYKAEHDKTDCPKFYNAIRKYGSENFRWEIIFQTPTKGTGLLVEQYFIAINNSMSHGYNVTSGGQSSSWWTGKKLSKEHKQKISDSLIGNKRHSNIPHTMAAKIKMSNTYKVLTPDNETIIVNHLKTFCEEHQFIYAYVKNAILARGKYKKYIFTKLCKE